MPMPARAKPSRFLLTHCDHFLSLGCSKSVANSANSSAQKIDIVIIAVPAKRPDWWLSPPALAQGPSAMFELRVPKVFRVRVAAIRRGASLHQAVRVELTIAELCDVLNLSC